MNDHQSPDATKALLAAMSALGLALGVTPAKADPPAGSAWGSSNTSDQSKANAQKTENAWGSTDEGQGAKSNQLKGSQLKSSQVKGTQLKSSQVKSSQIKTNGMEGGEHPQGMEGGETPQPH